MAPPRLPVRIKCVRIVTSSHLQTGGDPTLVTFISNTGLHDTMDSAPELQIVLSDLASGLRMSSSWVIHCGK
jgi:hypothetical protein